MSSLNRAAALAFLAVAACASVPQPSAVRSPSLGVPLTNDELAGWDISIPPSGAGLPPGGGTARGGAAVYDQKCAACHGGKGVGKPPDGLARGQGDLASKGPPLPGRRSWPVGDKLLGSVLPA